jgi:hypothetical protein
MKEEQIQHIITEVIRRLAVHLGANGSRGTLIAVFTGATVAFIEAIQQVRSLILDGYRVQLVFSQAAEDLYGQVARDQLDGFPHITMVETKRWLTALRESRAVIVPLLSMNTVSKVSMLIADNLPTNLILHSLFMGKAVFAARNGADADGDHWQKKNGAHTQSPAIRKALLKKLQVIDNYGCYLTDIRELRRTVNAFLTDTNIKDSNVELSDNAIRVAHSTLNHSGKILTAADVRHAHRLGADVILFPSTLITPLARDLAMHYDVVLLKKRNGN